MRAFHRMDVLRLPGCEMLFNSRLDPGVPTDCSGSCRQGEACSLIAVRTGDQNLDRGLAQIEKIRGGRSVASGGRLDLNIIEGRRIIGVGDASTADDIAGLESNAAHNVDRVELSPCGPA